MNYNLVKISGIISIIYGSFYFLLKGYAMCAMLIFIGIYLIVQSEKTNGELYRKKTVIVIIACLSLILCPIISILLLINLDRLKKISEQNAPPKTSNNLFRKETKSYNKMKVLLQLGTLLISISGILFATTNWNTISSFTKVVLLFCVSLFFLMVSILTEKKLNLLDLSNTYFVLSMIFFFITTISVSYFELFGKWLSYDGAGKNLLLGINFIEIATISAVVSSKLKNKDIMYIVYMALYIAAYFLLVSLNIEANIAISILMVLSFLINFKFSKNVSKYLLKISQISMYIYPIYILKNYSECGYINILVISLYTFFSYYQILKESSDYKDSILMIWCFILLSVLFNIIFGSKYQVVVFAIFISLLYLLVELLRRKHFILIINKTIYNILLGVTLLLSGIMHDPTTTFCISLIYLVINFLFSEKILDKEPSCDYLLLQPLAVLIFLAMFANLLLENNIDVNLLEFISLSMPIFILLKIKDDKKKYLNIHGLLMSMLFVLFVNLFDSNVLSIICIIIGSIYLFKLSENTNIKKMSYAISMFSVMILFQNCGFRMPYYCKDLIIIYIYLISIIVIGKDSIYKRILQVLLSISLFLFIKDLEVNIIIETILINLLLIYILYLAIIFFVKNAKFKNVLAALGISLIVLSIIFTADVIICIYVGVLALIVTLFGYYNKNYSYLFKVGIIAEIINVVYQLDFLWTEIPFWLYLLISGLLLIGIVTYKELKKENNKNKKEV